MLSGRIDMGQAYRGRDESQVSWRSLTVSLWGQLQRTPVRTAPETAKSQAPAIRRGGEGNYLTVSLWAVACAGPLFCFPFLCYPPAMKNPSITYSVSQWVQNLGIKWPWVKPSETVSAGKKLLQACSIRDVITLLRKITNIQTKDGSGERQSLWYVCIGDRGARGTVSQAQALSATGSLQLLSLWPRKLFSSSTGSDLPFTPESITEKTTF